MKQACKCQRCFREYELDVLVPDELWERIKPARSAKGGGLLCGVCIMWSLEDITGFGVCELKFPPQKETPDEAADRLLEHFKAKHGIKTYRQPHMLGWLAGRPKAPTGEPNGEGETELEAIKNLCAINKIPCDL